MLGTDENKDKVWTPDRYGGDRGMKVCTYSPLEANNYYPHKGHSTIRIIMVTFVFLKTKAFTILLAICSLQCITSRF